MFKKLNGLFKGMSDREVVALFYGENKEPQKIKENKNVHIPKTEKKRSNG